MERPVEVGLKKSRDLGGGEWLVWGQGPDPCLPAPPQERWCPPGHGAMYNGIGLPTPRGSGTNGYVQRNLSLVRGRRGERPDYKGLCPWAFPDKNTGTGCHFLLQGIFPTQGANPHLLHYKQILYH